MQSGRFAGVGGSRLLGVGRTQIQEVDIVARPQQTPAACDHVFAVNGHGRQCAISIRELVSEPVALSLSNSYHHDNKRPLSRSLVRTLFDLLQSRLVVLVLRGGKRNGQALMVVHGHDD
jgi:hypothetical protein